MKRRPPAWAIYAALAFLAAPWLVGLIVTYYARVLRVFGVSLLPAC